VAVIKSSSTDRLAAYAAAFRYEQLPAPAVAAAKLILLDTIGTTLLGSQPKYTASRLTGDLAKQLGGVPECTVIGRGFKTSVANAALANGTMGYAADAEGGGIGRQHLPAVAVPVVLTVGEREHASGKAIIAALALAYDVAGRIDRAADPHTFYPHSFHPSAVFGHFAAAAAAAHLLQLDQRQFVNALGLAGLNAGGLMAWVDDPTENSRPYVIGMAAHAGVLAAYLAQLGMGGPPGIADPGKFTIYDAFSGAVDPAQRAELTRGLGEDFWITRHGGFKRYPCCADIHAGLAGLLKIVAENDLGPDSIAEIVHHPHSARAPVIDNNPLRSHCAQYILAVAAARRGIDPDTILVDRRETDPAIREMVQRTRLIGDGESLAPEVAPGGAVVDVTTRDGRSFRQVVPRVPRLGERPEDRSAIEEKFYAFATTCLPLERARRVHALVDDLEDLEDAARLTELLAEEG
jgi:2-methylcitrate dehydratase PrpD